MDIVERIKELRDARGWTTYQLALEAGLTQSTLSSLFNSTQNSLPRLETLEYLCNAFGITLSQFFMEDEQGEIVSPQEKILLDNYRKLSPEKKKAVLTLLSE